MSLIFPIWAPTLAIRWWCQLASIGYRWVAQPPTRCTIMNYELYHMHACASWPARLPNGQTNLRPYRSPSEVDWEVSCRMDTISFMVIIYLHSINSGFTAPIGWFKLRGHLSYIHILTGEHHFLEGNPPNFHQGGYQSRAHKGVKIPTSSFEKYPQTPFRSNNWRPGHMS